MLLYLKACDLLAAFVIVDFFFLWNYWLVFDTNAYSCLCSLPLTN